MVFESDYLLSKASVLSVKCSACVGTGGQLVWHLVRVNDELQWSSHFPITQHMPEVTGGPSKYSTFMWLVEVRKDALCGPYIDSTFKRLVGGDLHGSVLTCFSFNPDNQTVNTADVTDKSSVFAVIGYEAPVWSGRRVLKLLILILGVMLFPVVVYLYMGVSSLKKTKKKLLQRSTRAAEGVLPSHLIPARYNLYLSSKSNTPKYNKSSSWQKLGITVGEQAFISGQQATGKI
ncbi:hypothetical protein RRG08_023599 [Elysia crispata]|uniref:Uncharacterized protein n=1 Tax=Elysia crispata TaxID=231223 RepID=A0AAE1B7N5_9GAST|nr:hypothetical protein RRG08_023599 [Elysia crispata]